MDFESELNKSLSEAVEKDDGRRAGRLLDKGACMHSAVIGDNRLSLLEHAASLGLCSALGALLKRNRLAKETQSAMMMAADAGQERAAVLCFERLLEQKAQAPAVLAALHFGARNGLGKFCERVLRKWSGPVKEEALLGPLARFGQLKCLRLLLDRLGDGAQVTQAMAEAAAARQKGAFLLLARRKEELSDSALAAEEILVSLARWKDRAAFGAYASRAPVRKFPRALRAGLLKACAEGFEPMALRLFRAAGPGMRAEALQAACESGQAGLAAALWPKAGSKAQEEAKAASERWNGQGRAQLERCALGCAAAAGLGCAQGGGPGL